MALVTEMLSVVYDRHNSCYLGIIYCKIQAMSLTTCLGVESYIYSISSWKML